MLSAFTGRRSPDRPFDMKKLLLLAFPLLAGPMSALAALHANGGGFAIPDGNPNGVFSSIAVSSEQSFLTSLSVTLDLSGGYNGDLYAYLSYNGTLLPLVNRPGISPGNSFGWDGAGMSVTLADSAAQNIHAAGNGFLNGSYRPDGQNLSPLSSAGSFNANGGTMTLNGTFGGMNPNGVWTLFLADVVSSGNSAVLNTWTLNITSVPEPNLSVLAFVAFAAACGRHFRRQ
jgi:hypothetical protein